MDEKLRRVYVPMTETGFYILFSLQEERHGYHVILSKMEKDQLIRFTREEEKRKYYQITELGSTVLQLELARINRLYINSKGGCYHGNKENL